MAALVDGARYGLSSQGHNNENKTLIFVKLTDSALKAIDEYLSHKGHTGRKPTIQFHGNQGSLTFPSSNSGEHSFDFTYSPASETEGLQGSFECVRQNGSRSLESSGAMQYKMHIHAKDDVYQKTKVKMAAAEEESKKNCTKVIKAAGPYMSRKVKVKKTLTHLPRQTHTSPSYTSSKPSNPLVSKPLVNGHLNGVSSFASSSNSSVSSMTSSSSNNNTVTSKSSSNPPKLHGNPEIMKRSYRERIIHLLAVRSYKKPELLARLMKDGIKEKDKKSLTSILSQVASMNNNSYQLAKHIWSEVQENWPFYTDDDRQLLKRRMAQNLSPSNGEDELSPSRNVSSHSPNFVQKRQSDDHDPFPNKKQRISHYTKQADPPVNHSKQESAHHHASKSDNYSKTDGHRLIGNHKHETNGAMVNGSKDGFKNDSSASEYSNHHRSDVHHHEGSYNGGLNHHHHHQHQHRNNVSASVKRDSSRSLSNSKDKGDDAAMGPILNGVNGYNHSHNSNHNFNGRLSKNSSSTLCNGSTGGSRHTTPSSSPESQDVIDFRGPGSQQSISSASPLSESESLQYHLKKYTVIRNPEQRTQYKSDFNAQYDEYRSLHAIIDRVSRRFASLEQHLRNVEDGTVESSRLRLQIVREYNENKLNQEYQDARRRFNYLHQKLSHIKKLVLEYDNGGYCDS